MLVIYKAEFPNGKVYIGKTKNFENRKYHHIWNSKKENYKHIKMAKAINKYGIDSIKWEIICECDNICEMNLKEIEFIKFYKSTQHKYGYNMVCGDKENYEIRTNFDEDYMVDIIKKKLKSNGHDPDKYIAMTDELKDEIIDDYITNRFSIKALVRKYSITKQRITRLLKSNGIEIDREKCRETNSKKFDTGYINKIIDLYKSGLNIKSIAEKEHLTIMIVSRILHDSGVRSSKRFGEGRASDGSRPKKNKR